MAKIKMKKGVNDITLQKAFKAFTISKSAEGIKEKTISTYINHFTAVQKHLNVDITFSEISKSDFEKMLVSLRSAGLSVNTIGSYVRTLNVFLHWCAGEGYTNISLPKIKEKETVKETYSDEELELLLKRPPADCSFCEYRNWVIINFLLNSGCRAATVRNIQNRDVNLADSQVIFRHTKNGKIQVIPLCSRMVNVLRGYMGIRGGKSSDYLFCDMYGEMLSANALRLAIAKYNQRRGVQKTSIHMFRHTFARKYLVDCGGNAFTLQKLLGHSTLAMTKRYCTIFDADIAKNYDSFSPLAKLYHPKERIKK
jgi:integrase/recombinase XerD